MKYECSCFIDFASLNLEAFNQFEERPQEVPWSCWTPLRFEDSWKAVRELHKGS